MAEHRKIEELTENLKNYASTNFEIFKLEATEKTSIIGSELITTITLCVVGFLFLVFASMGAGFYLSSRIGDTYSGFLIVGGFYLVLGLILMLGKKSLMERPLRDKIIRKVFSKN